MVNERKVLVVDDEKETCELMCDLLELKGYRADKAFDGLEALALMETNKYDIVFMNFQMPRMDGPTAARRIRELEKQGRPPSVIVGTSGFVGVRDECIEAGMDDFLAIPFQLDDLLMVLDKWTSSPRRGASMAELKQRVWVSGWKHSRQIIEDFERKKVMMEIALSHDHCPTCASRVRHVSRVLERKNVQHKWEHPEDSELYLVLDHPGKNVQLAPYLSELLDLRISDHGLEEPSTSILQDIINRSIFLGNLQVVHGLLGVIPILAGEIPTLPVLEPMEAALRKGTVSIREASESGEVPFLLFENGGDLPVIVLDGEEVVGGKQNRIINTTLVIPGSTTVKIPVSCIQAGRWKHDRADFRSGHAIFPARSHAAHKASVTANVHSSGNHRSDQHTVWNHVSHSLNTLGVHSPTLDFR